MEEEEGLHEVRPEKESPWELTMRTHMEQSKSEKESHSKENGAHGWDVDSFVG